MNGQPPLLEVATKTSRPDGRPDVRWFTVEIRVGGIPVTTSRYTTDPTDTFIAPAESAAHAERQARAAFGRRLAALFAAPDRALPA